MRQSHLGCDKHMYRGRFCRLFWRRQSAAGSPVPTGSEREAAKRGRYPREAEQLKAMKVALRSHLAAQAYFLCGIAAAIWALEAFGVALHNSQDNDWGPARALLHGLDPYKLYLHCASCPKPPFLPPVAPMYPASGLILLWPLA